MGLSYTPVNPMSHCDLHCIATLVSSRQQGLITWDDQLIFRRCNENLCHVRSGCRGACWANLGSQGGDCIAVCEGSDIKSTRAYSSEQKAVEEKPVERSLSSELSYTPVNPMSHCDLHCIATLVSSRQQGLITWDDQLIFRRCNENLCHVRSGCRGACWDNLGSQGVDCIAVCEGSDIKSTRAYSSEQKAVEEKPVERSLSSELSYTPVNPMSHCDLHCIATLVSSRQQGPITR